MTIANLLFDGDTLDGREVGIEIEVEGENLPTITPMGWRAEHDGSLRGEGYEYVLSRPVPRNRVTLLLERLKEVFDGNNAKVWDTGRAGVHVHINIRDLTKTQLFNFICLYIIFEDVLVNYCGKDRAGNLFCLRVKDAEYLVEILEDVTTGDLEKLRTDDIRYASMNCKAIPEYGSLEFRAMRSTMDLEVLSNWVKILLCLKDSALTFLNPREIVKTMSWDGPNAFAESVFGEMLSCFPVDDWHNSVFQGIRKAQTIAYSSKWEEEDGKIDDREGQCPF